MSEEHKTNGGDAAAVDDESSLYYQDASAGLEKVTLQDLQVPFLTILQPLSPQVNKRNSEYVEGAEPGNIYNIATQELYESIDFVPAEYQRRYTEWKPRETGGGLVRDWGSDDSRLLQCKRDEKSNRDTTPDGNIIVTSGTFFGILVPMGERAVIAFASTQLKKARRWLSTATSLTMERPDEPGSKFTLPLFSTVYRLSSIPEKNDKGEWFGWKIQTMDRVMKLPGGKALYLEARRMREDVIEQRLTLTTPPQAIESPHQTDEIPF